MMRRLVEGAIAATFIADYIYVFLAVRHVTFVLRVHQSEKNGDVSTLSDIGPRNATRNGQERPRPFFLRYRSPFLSLEGRKGENQPMGRVK